MAEGDGHIYRTFKARVMKGDFDLVNDTIKCALLTGHTLDEDGHDVWGDVSADEITHTSYTAATLASNSVTASGSGTGTSVLGKFDAGDVTFSSLDGDDPNYAVLYDDSITGTAADALIGAWELTTATNGGNYTIQWSGDGIIRIK